MGSPADTELLAASRELADEVGHAAVVGVASGRGTQDGHRVVGDALPVAEEVDQRGLFKKMNRAMFAGGPGP